MYVKECELQEADPIVFYKPQGSTHERLNKEDFCLVMMNKSQEDMFKQFGSNIIAIDSTHGLNGYDFELTTIMVVDNFGEGFPCACMITNRKDTLVFQLFFDCIKAKLGIISAKTFMSDITNVFYNAWLMVMGPVTYRLFCSWHIDRAWQSNLSKITGGVDKKKQVYGMVKVLLLLFFFNKYVRSLVFGYSLYCF